MSHSKIIITPTLFMEVVSQLTSEVVIVKLYDRNLNMITAKITSFKQQIKILSCQAELLEAIQLLNLVRMNTNNIFISVNEYKAAALKSISDRQLIA